MADHSAIEWTESTWNPTVAASEMSGQELNEGGYACSAFVKRRRPGLDWVVVGGESGAGHRPMDPDWVRSLRDQCTEAKVPFFFKQWGGRTPKSGGRELDGRTWDEYPAAVFA